MENMLAGVSQVFKVSQPEASYLPEGTFSLSAWTLTACGARSSTSWCLNRPTWSMNDSGRQSVGEALYDLKLNICMRKQITY